MEGLTFSILTLLFVRAFASSEESDVDVERLIHNLNENIEYGIYRDVVDDNDNYDDDDGNNDDGNNDDGNKDDGNVADDDNGNEAVDNNDGNDDSNVSDDGNGDEDGEVDGGDDDDDDDFVRNSFQRSPNSQLRYIRRPLSWSRRRGCRWKRNPSYCTPLPLGR
ncbi:putative uncharacterized protein DDB_G0287265 [Hydractinia symbiolongicarpus]|uniref:putative uncharacterized protein DDB_G0287265 n=1 Tax=Hydractinia symbiolongicarpus TaxID=13093 RepID=UPI00254DCBC2|nr:putative uncharacterized protein DDB_G0287265 [Hydractinia symbiolongicarpus]